MRTPIVSRVRPLPHHPDILATAQTSVTYRTPGGVLLTVADWSPVASLGEGGVERWVAYPVVLWTVSFGSSLCHGRDPDAPLHRTRGRRAGYEGT